MSAQLVAANVDVIVAPGNAASRAALQATSTIPVVLVSGDPVTAGFVSSLARPTANATGLYVPSPELEAKRLELLKELVPSARRVALSRILKGAKPVDLPVEEVTKFELIIDLREARALGLDVPNELIMRADEVIR